MKKWPHGEIECHSHDSGGYECSAGMCKFHEPCPYCCQTVDPDKMEVHKNIYCHRRPNQ